MRKKPTKADKIIKTLKRERGGNLRHQNMDERNTGKSELWQTAVKMFNLHFKRLGFEKFERVEKIEREVLPVQQNLF